MAKTPSALIVDADLQARYEAKQVVKASGLTLAVAPEDAPLLALAQDQGTVWLVLRGQGDDAVRDVGPVPLP